MGRVGGEELSGIDFEEDVWVFGVDLGETEGLLFFDEEEDLAVEQGEPLGDGDTDETGLHFLFAGGVLVAEGDAVKVLDAAASLDEGGFAFGIVEGVEIGEGCGAVEAMRTDAGEVRGEGEVVELWEEV